MVNTYFSKENVLNCMKSLHSITHGFTHALTEYLPFWRLRCPTILTPDTCRQIHLWRFRGSSFEGPSERWSLECAYSAGHWAGTPQRCTALIVCEPARYSIDIAVLSDTRLPEDYPQLRLRYCESPKYPNNNG